MKLITLYAWVNEDYTRKEVIEMLQESTSPWDISFIQFPPKEKV